MSRTFERTHPWIKFRADYKRLDYRTWMLLGEAQSKCEHILGAPLLPKVAQKLHQIYLAKGVAATTAIEGNTLTEHEVQRRLEGKLPLPPSKQYLGQEIDNVVEACSIIAAPLIDGQSTDITVEDIKTYNRLLLKELPLEEGVIPGEVRTYAVGVMAYRGAPAEDCEYLLQRYCDWLNAFETPDASRRIVFGILKSILAHVYFAWIHPFGDGNGRTARLIEFQILLASGLPSAAAHLLSNHYNQTRTEYYRQLDITSKSGGNLEGFVQYAVQGLVDGLKEQLRWIKAQQVTVHWQDYIYGYFRDKETKAERRRRDLVLALSSSPEPVQISKVRYITPAIAEAYAGKTDKTVQRDLNYLIEGDLVIRTPKGVLANIALMEAFRPASRLEDGQEMLVEALALG